MAQDHIDIPMIIPSNCPRCNGKFIRNCCYIAFSCDNEGSALDLITIYFKDSNNRIYIYLDKEPETSIIYNDFNLVLPYPLPQLMYKTEPELNEWVKAMFIFQ